MTLRPILKAMPKYRRRQRSSAHSSFSSSPASTPTSPDTLPLSSTSSNLSSPCSLTSSRGLQLSSLPSPSLSPLVTSPHVHFPPTPAISSTQLTHSASTYDRAPIEVSPNSCELPERGGRVYDVCSPDSVCHAPRTGGTCAAPKGSYFHPNAFEACETESVDVEEPDPAHEHEPSLSLSPSLSSPSSSPSPSYFSPNYVAPSYMSSLQSLNVPSLTHDLSSASSSSCSESEDSDMSPNPCRDGYSSPHPYINSFSPPVSSPTNSEHSSSSYPSSPYPLSGLSAAPDSEEFAYALSFLPSSPHPPPKGSPHPHKHARKRHSKRTLRGDQTPKLSPRSRAGMNEWDEGKLDGCLGGF